MNTALLYALFALAAILVNLGTQLVCFTLYHGPLELYLALACGTLTGLLTKYILDKKYIFWYIAADFCDDTKKFILYSCMGTMTTLIFWATEIGFYHLFDFQHAKYVGGALGLTIGYILKYRLDKKWVFRTSCNL
ncbi:GtrA family protein [Desulfonatronospira sp.]|uniref:GtrA family protein n=1 Tax=Desulfonatronospira sp. TaxID=1962951 RepID=UPI0025C3DCC9|nr:GtrA family protein [Desulfonatronospira sp.]